MKKHYLVSLFTLSALMMATSGMAQEESVEVSIDLSTEVLSLIVNDKNVLFTYAEAKDYEKAQTVTRTGQLEVTSNTPYNIQVTVDESVVGFETTEETETIPLNVLQITATPVGEAVPGAPVTLGSEDPVVSGAKPGIKSLYNVDYTIQDATQLLGRNKTVYSATIKYTATAQ